MSDFDLWALQDLLAKREELAHLRAQKRGDTLIVLSGPKDDALKHFRLQALPAQRWALAFPNRGGRWEPSAAVYWTVEACRRTPRKGSGGFGRPRRRERARR